MDESDPRVPANVLKTFAQQFLVAMGCQASAAVEVAEHLVNAELCGVYSHGVFRLVQYANDARAGVFDPGGEPVLTCAGGGGPLVDGGNGFGMPALRLGVDHAVRLAGATGAAAVGIANVAHTGRLGEFVERAAREGCLCIVLGGGTRKNWRQVAPHGGAKGMLPTNPYAFGMPAGEGGPVVLDFATSAGAGGKVYAAHLAGRLLPDGLCIDSEGRPTKDPQDYLNGGALLPMAGAKGFGLGLIAELIGEAIFGNAMSGMNWICVCIDLGRYRDGSAYRLAAEDLLAELRACPPAPGFDQVEIPGERERRLRAERLAAGVPLPAKTLAALKDAAQRLGLDVTELLAH